VDRDPASDLVRETERWLIEHPRPSGAELAAAGYVVPHWPHPWGLAASPVEQLAIDTLLRDAAIRRPINPIGIGWAGPTLLAAGSPEQQERWLPRLLSGEDFWCQLFSEPGAGSDLSALTTRAVKDGDEWVVTGQKVWTSYAHVARWGILLARTDDGAERHHGITYFVCPMDAPGIEIRPLVDMTGDHAFNEVFFDEVRIPAANVIGQVNDGWRLAKVTLANERVSLSGEGLLWGMGPTIDDVLRDVLDRPVPLSAIERDRVVSVWSRAEVIKALKVRLVAAAVSGRTPGPEASVRKALADDLGQDAMELAVDLLGLDGLLDHEEGTSARVWTHGFAYSQALTIGGGTSVVQRNIIAERVLGLPRDAEGGTS
jgi:alkylation response protein AidB-like acyl-CoA dehydrogenase